MSYLKSFIPFVLIVISIAGYAYPARANCMEECLGRHDCDADYLNGHIKDAGNECQMYLDDCQDECVDSDKVANIFGALAYDPTTRAWGLSEPSRDKDSAAQAALNLCRPNGPHCTVMANYSNTCVSVAVGKDSVVAWAEGEAIDNAQDSARDACADKGGGKCSIKQSHCYFP